MTSSMLSMQGALRPLVLSVVAAAAAAGAVVSRAGAATDSFTFRYAPPPDTRFVQTYLMTRERSIDGMPAQLDTAESKTEITIRKIDDDYDIVAKPVLTVMKKDHELIDDPVSAILSGIEPVYRVGADGQVKEVRGFAGIADRLAAVLPPGVAEAVASLISEPAMVEREKAEWRARYGELAGRTFRIGDIVEARQPYRMPNGEVLEHSVQTYFTRWEPCPAGQCVRVDISYESEEVAGGDAGAAASAAAVDAAASAATAASTSDPAASAASAATAASAPTKPLRRISGSTSRLIDPQTMRLYAEQQTKTLTMAVEVPERGKLPAVFREQSRYEFDYR